MPQIQKHAFFGVTPSGEQFSAVWKIQRNDNPASIEFFMAPEGFDRPDGKWDIHVAVHKSRTGGLHDGMVHIHAADAKKFGIDRVIGKTWNVDVSSSDFLLANIAFPPNCVQRDKTSTIHHNGKEYPHSDATWITTGEPLNHTGRVTVVSIVVIRSDVDVKIQDQDFVLTDDLGGYKLGFKWRSVPVENLDYEYIFALNRIASGVPDIGLQQGFIRLSQLQSPAREPLFEFAYANKDELKKYIQENGGTV